MEQIILLIRTKWVLRGWGTIAPTSPGPGLQRLLQAWFSTRERAPLGDLKRWRILWHTSRFDLKSFYIFKIYVDIVRRPQTFSSVYCGSEVFLKFSCTVAKSDSIMFWPTFKTTNQKEQMPPQCLSTLTFGIQIHGQPISNFEKNNIFFKNS